MATYLSNERAIKSELIKQLETLEDELFIDIKRNLAGVASYAMNDKGHEMQQKIGWIGGLKIAIAIINDYFSQMESHKMPNEKL